jgi:opacity protein-like surface antigen
MRSFAILSVMAMTLARPGAAQAQTGPASAASSDSGYVEVVAQSAFGNVTSQNFGAEVGVAIALGVQVFAEVGQTRDVATSALGSNALKIAGAVAAINPSASYSVKEPVTFGAVGVRYLLPVSGKTQPYVLGGLGIAKVTSDVKFFVGGSDVTASLQQDPYQIVLGSDLSGSFTKPMFVVGGGVTYPVWKQLVFDFQLRFGRIFAEDEGITVGRAGLGVGFRF